LVEDQGTIVVFVVGGLSGSKPNRVTGLILCIAIWLFILSMDFHGWVMVPSPVVSSPQGSAQVVSRQELARLKIFDAQVNLDRAWTFVRREERRSPPGSQLQEVEHH
jgi:hypothetical protein